MANLVEGSRRIKILGIIALKCSVASSIAGGLLLLYSVFVIPRFAVGSVHANTISPPATLLALQLWSSLGTLLLFSGFWLAICGSIACLAAWIIAGFGAPPQGPAQRVPIPAQRISAPYEAS